VQFHRVVEIFPPRFPKSATRLDIEEKVDRFIEQARSVRDYADTVLIADVKNPKYLKLSSLEAALLLHDRTRVEAAPVLVLRGMSREKLLSDVMTGVSLGLRAMMLAWGDDYPASVKSSNVRDYATLAGAISDAAGIRRKTRSPTLLFAPVDMRQLGTPGGASMAEGRLKSGADYLLAQPPTTDPGDTFDQHLAALDSAGLRDRVFLNVFPFRGSRDVRDCEKYFGWKLPRQLHRDAEDGEAELIQIERRVVERMREENLPGIYLNTRGNPGIAGTLLS
jgi:5,10-methylenetetrahydrofolate reductase